MSSTNLFVWVPSGLAAAAVYLGLLHRVQAKTAYARGTGLAVLIFILLGEAFLVAEGYRRRYEDSFLKGLPDESDHGAFFMDSAIPRLTNVFMILIFGLVGHMGSIAGKTHTTHLSLTALVGWTLSSVVWAAYGIGIYNLGKGTTRDLAISAIVMNSCWPLGFFGTLNFLRDKDHIDSNRRDEIAAAVAFTFVLAAGFLLSAAIMNEDFSP